MPKTQEQKIAAMSDSNDDIIIFASIGAVLQEQDDEEVKERAAEHRQAARALSMSEVLETASFKQLYRLHPSTFSKLIGMLQPFVAKTGRPSSVSLERGVKMYLLHLAGAQSYTSLMGRFGETHATVERTIHRIRSMVVRLLDQVVVFPEGEGLTAASDLFAEVFGFPGCIGAIDGSHIPYIALRETKKISANHKGFVSMVLMAIVDANRTFRAMSVGMLGSQHDARCMRFMQVIQRQISSNVSKPIPAGYYILGDAAFPASAWLVTPFDLTPSRQLRKFNKEFSAARCVVECAFGQLKMRWRLLLVAQHGYEATQQNVGAAVVLHNLITQDADYYKEEALCRDVTVAWDRDKVRATYPELATEESRREGRALRDQLMQLVVKQ